MSTFKFWLIFIASLLVAFLMIATGWVRSSLPQTEGVFLVKGPSEDITIHRDARGIPHISGANRDDLAFGLGYVHAQDRLWQMEMNRRIGRGELAEILGEPTIGIDTFFRTLGFRRKAEKALVALPDDVVRTLELYRDGVNTFIAEHRGAWPPEFLLTGTEPRPWDVVDTLVWQKVMWLDLSGNAQREIARAQLLTKLHPSQVQTLYPPYPGESAAPLPMIEDLYAEAPLDAVAQAFGPAKPEGYGSNNWVVSGAFTQNGMPLLANDPHLGLSTPSIWYLAHLYNRSKQQNMVGVGFPGSPSIVLGRNDRISWGFTNTAPDVQDLFIEKLVGENQYLTPDGPADFTVHEEVIKVRGGKDITLNVRETRHGPVVSDIYPDSSSFTREGHVISLQWTALRDDDRGLVGLVRLAEAQNFDEFKAAGAFYAGPQQNMIYADVDGNIGYYAPALVPVRRPDNEINGRLPSPGWLAKYDWQGFLPYNELPERFNPESGVIATANEKIVDENYPHFITGDWSLPYRGNRIRDQLLKRTDHTPETFGTLQADTVSDMARDLLPWLMKAVEKTTLKDMLTHWDGTMNMDRPEPLIFYTWLRHYQDLLIDDELEESAGGRFFPRLIKSTLYWSVNQPTDDWNTGYYALPVLPAIDSLPWCDIITTEETETCRDLANRAMAATIVELSQKYGDNPDNWLWRHEHIAVQEHRPMSQIPGLKDVFELKTPISGGIYTINVAGVSQNKNRLNQSLYGPSYRGIFDMGNPDASLYVQPTGQSGNPFSPHYSDQFDMWRSVDYFTLPTDKVRPDDTEATMILKPVGE